jgi:nucleotide-binding universal stress UspA family protein
MSIPQRTIVCLIHSCDPQLRAMYSGLSDVQDEGGELILVAIADPRDGQSLGHRLSDRSFVGLKLATEVERLTTQHEEDRLQEQLQHAQEEARKAGISAGVVFEEGEVAATFQKIVKRIHPTRTHVPRLPQSLGDRLLRGDSTDSLTRSLDTTVIITD